MKIEQSNEMGTSEVSGSDCFITAGTVRGKKSKFQNKIMKTFTLKFDLWKAREGNSIFQRICHDSRKDNFKY